MLLYINAVIINFFLFLSNMFPAVMSIIYNHMTNIPYNDQPYKRLVTISLLQLDKSLKQLSFRAAIQRTQFRNYRDNKIQRLDIDILRRLCYVLKCDLTDLIEYIPPDKQE